MKIFLLEKYINFKYTKTFLAQVELSNHLVQLSLNYHGSPGVHAREAS